MVISSQLVYFMTSVKKKKVLRSWAKDTIHRHDAMDCLKERDTKKRSTPQSILKGQKRTNADLANIWTINNYRLWGKLLTGKGFPEHPDIILNWTAVQEIPQLCAGKPNVPPFPGAGRSVWQDSNNLRLSKPWRTTSGCTHTGSSKAVRCLLRSLWPGG